MRGTLPGLLHPVQDCGDAFTSGTTLEGTNEFLGRKLMAWRVGPPVLGGEGGGTVFIDSTGPWSR